MELLNNYNVSIFLSLFQFWGYLSYSTRFTRCANIPHRVAAARLRSRREKSTENQPTKINHGKNQQKKIHQDTASRKVKNHRKACNHATNYATLHDNKSRYKR